MKNTLQIFYTLWGVLLILLTSQFCFAAAPVSTVNNKANMPFGSNLFSGKFQSQSNDGLDPNYRLIPGDKVALHMWGQVTIDEILTVDAKGNIFIPEVGEVKVSGARAAELPTLVKRKVSTVFKQGENVYVNIVTATPISVYVTGPVLKPGQYSGIASESVLSFLHKAGGIDGKRGSYRDVKVLRGNRRIAQFDLYPFLTSGKLKHIKFRDGDTIVVGKLGSTISVSGHSRNPFLFEFLGRQMTGRQLIQFARPEAKVTHVQVSGSRNRKPWSAYLYYNQFLNTRLLDGDRVTFKTDARSAVTTIHVEGSYLGNSYYEVKRGSRLKEVLDYIEVDPEDADINNIYIKRKSVAAQQKKSLKESIQRIQRSVLLVPAQSTGEAAIRAEEAKMVLKYVELARESDPEGRVVVSENGQVANIRLENGDVIVIPKKSDIVTISGEVFMPKAMVYARNATIEDYIIRAGGYAQRADRQHIVVMHPNGRVQIGNKQRVMPGDQIIVFPRIDQKNMQNARDWLQVLSQIAVSASVLGF
jgi:protein involved in polysaccharide export with SLBB domain